MNAVRFMSSPCFEIPRSYTVSGVDTGVKSLFDCLAVAAWLGNIACLPANDLGPGEALQACMPSNHVCSKFGSPKSPHFLNQAPPRKQQLILPSVVAPHLGQVIGRVEALVVTAAIFVVLVRNPANIYAFTDVSHHLTDASTHKITIKT